MPTLDVAAWTGSERRQLTVMSCDLVNSVALSNRFDPEDLAEIIGGYQSSCERIVEQFDGYVARFTGDGLKVYFGYPHAEEYTAERAVRAALAVVNAVKVLDLRPGLVLSTRVGIATGDVVVGDLVGTGEAQERTVAGKAPNVAARLQELGLPDSVTIEDSTKQLLGSLFEYEDLGRQTLKGFPERVQAWRVLAEAKKSRRFEALHAEATLSPLLGRDADLAFLRECWHQVKAGKGQTVLLSGEAGVGKSRLVMAFRRSLGTESFSRLRHYCSPYHQNSSFYPIIRQIEETAGIASADGPDVRLAKLEKSLRQVTNDVYHALPAIAMLLSIPTNAANRPLASTPAQQRRRAVQALEQTVVALTSIAPLLLVFEDMHWADPSTREFLDAMIDRLSSLRVMLVMTTRPQPDAPWERHPGVSVRVLRRLSRDHSEEIVQAIDVQSALPRSAIEQILEYSEGLPLYVEELTRSTLESRREHEEGRMSQARASQAPQVPYTLHESLLARLHRLGPWKIVAQTAAVIGRTFTFKQLRTLFRDESTRLAEALQALIGAGIIIEQSGGTSEAAYRFTHALLQETASACLLHAARRAIHQRIAEALETDFPETVAVQPELVALHYSRAGLDGRAIAYWHRAAESALERFANVEAVHHFNQALARLETQPPSADRDATELTLRTRLGATLSTVKGFAAPDVAAAYERSRVLYHASKDAGQRFSVLRGCWGYSFVRADWQAANDFAEEMLALSSEQNDSGFEVEAHRAIGMAALWRGMFTHARAHLERGLQLYDSGRHRNHALHYGNDPGIACRVHNAFVLYVLGYPDQALQACHTAIEDARKLGHPFSLTQALIYAMFIHERRGEAHAVRELCSESKSVASEYGFPFWLAEATMMHGWAVAVLGDPASGLTELRQGLNDFLATGARMDKPRWLSLLIDCYCRSNHVAHAFDACAEALGVLADTDECFFQARVYQLRGELSLKQGGPDAARIAEQCFLEALQVARRQQARSWELCAATSLARLWLAQARRRDAHALLLPIYSGFSEGFETSDLQDAKSLLVSLV